MAYRMKRTWKDFVEGPKHSPLTRRDFLKRGLATGAMTVALPKLFGSDFIKAAEAGTLHCLQPLKVPGAIAQIYSSGGPTMGARFIGDQQAAHMNTTMAQNYGITGTLQKLGPGMWIDKKSIFGMTLLAGPPGFAGGPTGWQNAVLTKICAGGHLGPFNLDDGVGLNSGLVGSVSMDKTSLIGKDIFFNPAVTRAPWTSGTPAVYSNAFGTPQTASVINAFSLNPPASGVFAGPLTTAAEMTNAANGAAGLAQALSTSFKTLTRKGGADMINSASCSFFGNSALVDPTFGVNLFTATNLAPLNSSMTLSMMTDEENALAASYYQSAMGVIGGVSVTYGGRDYHSADIANSQDNVLPADMEDARNIVMFLAACHAAGQPGAMMYVSNGQAIGAGTTPVTATINGVSGITIDAQIAHGDAGGHYNAGLILFYHPSGSLPTATYSGTLMSDSGDVRMGSGIGSFQNALAGLYLTAHKYIGGTGPNTAHDSLLTRLQKMGLAPIPDNITLI